MVSGQKRIRKSQKHVVEKGIEKSTIFEPKWSPQLSKIDPQIIKKVTKKRIEQRRRTKI